MDDERFDLSTLDLRRDPARFERMVQAVVAGVGPPAPLPHPMALQLVRQGRLAMAFAALLALAAWIPSLARERPAARAEAADPVTLVSAWAASGQPPAGADLLRAVGAADGR